MKSLRIRGSVVAAVAGIVVLGTSITAPAHAQQAAHAVNPEIANPELAAKGVWNTNTTYAKEDIVTARGSTWISLKTGNKGKVPGSTQPNTARDWQLFAEGLNPTGAWLGSAIYHANDLVTHLGETWRAKRTNRGKTPIAGVDWEKVAAKGDVGEKGATGDKGDQGDRGAQGLQGSQGPQGPQGIQGPQGSQGVQGPPGPNVVSGGSQGMPSISFSGDSDTGIFSPAAGQLALVENGALFLHNQGFRNTALGLGALANTNEFGNSNTNSNTAIGTDALANVLGAGNTAVGSRALWSGSAVGIIIGATAVGDHALSNNTANFNTAVGANALSSNGSGTGNTAVGYDALTGNFSGTGNTAVGTHALQGNSIDSTAVGHNALTNSTSENNTAVGANAGFLLTSGMHNTALGAGALSANMTGTSNVAIGASALSDNRGSNNIAIGTAAGQNATHNVSNSILIGHLGAGASDSNTIRIGTSQTRAFVAGIANEIVAPNSVAVLIDPTTGQLGTVPSSRRYKEDIAPMVDISGILTKLRPVTFHYKPAHDDGKRELQYGLIAEEVAEVLPYLTVFNKNGRPETVKYHLLPSFLLAGYQAQQKAIAAQAEKIDAQAEQMRQQQEINAALEARLARLEAALLQTKGAALRR